MTSRVHIPAAGCDESKRNHFDSPPHEIFGVVAVPWRSFAGCRLVEGTRLATTLALVQVSANLLDEDVIRWESEGGSPQEASGLPCER
jgi:hypothetical protein